MKQAAANRLLFFFGILKIPMIGYCNPKIVAISEEEVVIRIRLRKRTRNHLGSMYFGALCVGADLAGGFLAFLYGRETGQKFSLIFANFQAEFLARAESDVYFIARNGKQVQDVISRSLATGERVTEPTQIEAVINYPQNPVAVARFTLGLSVKAKQEGK